MSSRIESIGTVDPKELELLQELVLKLDVVWADILKSECRLIYYPPRFVMYRGDVTTSCGEGQMRFGPFYCSGDRTVYVDHNWFDVLFTEYGAKQSDLAKQFVVAHEIGHHIQEQMGIFHRIISAPGESSLRVRGELQADAFAGYSLKRATELELMNLKKESDMSDALNVANQVGDDIVHKRKYGELKLNRMGHGTAKQRKIWLMKGFKANTISECDTFDVADLDNP